MADTPEAVEAPAPAAAPEAPTPQPEAPPKAAKAKPAPAQPNPIDQVIDAWLADRIRGGPIARNTECWNHLADALPALKAALSEEN